MIIIRPERYRQTKDALEAEGFSAFSAMNVLGRGKKLVEFSAGDGSSDSKPDSYHRLMTKKLMIVYINDEDESRLSEIVIKVNQTEQEGDGKLFVIPVKRSIRIRTGEENEDALV
ncbi:MAG: P-II family nitrogen regulator [Desulfosporosinus sp.]|nr:P-II family nitrogen regulator [Desulfosporosinus sp.]